MEVVDVAIWLLAGMLAGWLAGAANPGMRLQGRLAVIGAGVAGALIGGAIADKLSGTIAIAFLGAASAAVTAAMSIGAILRR